MKKIILLMCFFILPLTSYAHKLTIIYTGNSYSSLYPCGHCPASVGGGVARRASVINDVKSKAKNTIVIDAGEFTAGGALDEASKDVTTDKNRAIYNYKALQAMGYEIVGVGDAEFNFGVDFLKDNIKKFKLNAISANLVLEGVRPYYIKEFSGFKVGIIGLSPQSISKKSSSADITDYDAALTNTINKIKNKVDFIILVSPLGDEVNKAIANKFTDVKLILSSGNMLDSKEYEKVNDTIIMKPSYLAKEVRIINIEIKANKILTFDLKQEKLALSVKENPEIKKIIPACFKDGDCQRREGLLATCQKQGSSKAACVYFEPNRIEAILITDTACSFCVTEPTQNLLREIFLGINFKVVDYNTPYAKELIKKYSLISLPAFIMPQEIKTEKEFPRIAKFIDEKDGKLLLKPQLSGLFLLLNRKEIPRRLDYFVDLYEPSALTVFNDLSSFCKKEKIKLDVHFLLSEKNVYGYPKEEIQIALAVKKVAPDKFLEYLAKRLSDIKNTSWTDSLEAVGIDYKKIKGTAKSKVVDRMIEDNNRLISELNVNYGNVILVNNNKIFTVLKIKTEDLEKIFGR
ncbi:MAG: hypothetical protein M0R48_08340 [Candidatus Omnitrophica bacterium]|jgi:hypothetical protein|nr:hypothetical protein [Candidatus Omnitrophota bacterium]